MASEWPNDAQANCVAETFDADVWRICVSKVQTKVQQFTHTRKLDLPTTLDAYICGCTFRAQYCGHGVYKVAYLLEALHPNEGHQLHGKVLKLSKAPDPEPLCSQRDQRRLPGDVWASSRL